MRDTVDTALSFGLVPDRAHLEFTPFALEALYQPEHPQAQGFLDFLNHWTQLTTLLNEMSRSMGQPDFYPFVLPHEAVAKLHFIHLLITSGPPLAAGEGAKEMPQTMEPAHHETQPVSLPLQVHTQVQQQASISPGLDNQYQ